MSASSVTGTGTGAATNKGPINHNTFFAPLNGPRVVCAGTVTTDGGGGATVTFPKPLPGGWNAYVIMATQQYNVGGASAVHVGGAENEEGLTNITIIGGANRIISYAVFSVGPPYHES